MAVMTVVKTVGSTAVMLVACLVADLVVVLDVMTAG